MDNFKLVRLILSVRFTALKNYIFYGRNADGKNSYKYLPYSLLGLLFAGPVLLVNYLLFFSIFNILSKTSFYRSLNGKEVIYSALFVVIFIYMFFSRLLSRTADIKSAPDVVFLATSPISNLTFFWAKFLEKFLLKAFILSVFIILPAVVAFGLIFSPSWGFYFFLVPLLLLYFIFPLALQATVVIGFIRLSIKKVVLLKKYSYRIRMTIITIGLLISSEFASRFVYQLIVKRWQAITDLRIIIASAVNNLILIIGKIGLYLPSRIWAKSLSNIDISLGASMKYFFLAILISVFMLVLAHILTKKIAPESTITQVHNIIKIPKISSSNYLIRVLASPFAAPYRSILLKDVKIILRSKKSLTGILASSIISLIIINMLNGVKTSIIIPKSFYPFSFYYLVLISFISIPLTRELLPWLSIDGEGRNFALFQVAPLDMEKVLITKFYLLSFFISLLAATLMIIAAVKLQISVLLTFVGMIVGLVVTLSVASIIFGLSAIFPIFDWEKREQAGTSFWAFYIGHLLVSAYIFLTALLLLIPLERYLASYYKVKPLFAASPARIWIMTSLMFLALSLIAILAPLKLGADRLEIIYEKTHRTLKV